MPKPNYVDPGYDPTETLDRDMEIIGRGPDSRRTKTYLKDGELATVAAGLAAHIEQVESCLRLTHARHYAREVEYELGDGTVETRTEPEVLDHYEIRERYPVLKKMERFHREQLEHYASIQGFSIKSVAGHHDPRSSRKAPEDGSAGADNLPGQQGRRWNG